MINSYKLETVTITPFAANNGYGGTSYGVAYTQGFFIERKLIYGKGPDNITFLKGRAILKTSNDIALNDKDKINFDSTDYRIVEISKPRSWGLFVLEIMVV